MPPVKKKGGPLRVVAPLVAITSENGSVLQLFRGDIVPEGTKQESIDHLLSLGYVVESDAPSESDEK
jgi:hypothetical protein